MNIQKANEVVITEALGWFLVDAVSGDVLDSSPNFKNTLPIFKIEGRVRPRPDEYEVEDNV